MFTGIVEEIGVVSRIEKRMGVMRIAVSCLTCLEGLKLGASIAVNGICLTATEIKSDLFFADVSGETVKISNLGNLRPGSVVNLERAARFNDRIEGHIVSGHVDGIGRMKRKQEQPGTITYEISLPNELIKYCIKKGSIALDGVSLTINEVTSTSVFLLTIPHTIKMTTFSQKQPGDMINVEVDMMAKYIEKMLKNR